MISTRRRPLPRTRQRPRTGYGRAGAFRRVKPLSAAGTAAALSVLTSIATSGIGEQDSPALVSTGRHARPE